MKITVGRVAGVFAAVVLVVVFAVGAWVLHSRDGVEEVSCDALEENTQGIQAEGTQAEDIQEEQSEPVNAFVQETLRESEACLERGEYLEALQVLMDAQKEQADETLADREAYLRENIVVLGEQRYFEGKPREEYRYDTQGNQIECTGYDSDGNLMAVYMVEPDGKRRPKLSVWDGITTLCEYDEEGNKIRTFYRTDGSISAEILDNSADVTIRYISYNEDGSIANWSDTVCDDQGRGITFFDYNEDGSVAYRTENEYDSEGQRIRVIDFTERGAEVVREEYAYDTAGNRIKEVRYNQYGGVEKWEECRYDAAGNEIAFINYNSDGSIYTRIEKQYDEAGNETESIGYRGDGTVFCRYVREYDETGRVLKSWDYGENGELESTYEYVYDPARYQGTGYTYDSAGKLLEQTEWTFDILGNVLTRQDQNGISNYVYEYGLATPLPSI